MKPESGQYVKCFMRNSNVLEGIVEVWSDAEVVLKSLDGESLLIIHRPVDDIMLTKIVLTEFKKESLEKPQENIREKLHETMAQSNDTDLQKKSVAELREMVLEQEKEIIAQKRKEHFGSVGAAKLTQYSSPINPKPVPVPSPRVLQMYQNRKYFQR